MPNHNHGGIAKEAVSWLMPLAFAAVAAFYISGVMSYDAVLEATVDGVPCGYVDSLSTLADAENSVELALSNAVGEKLSLDAKVEYSLEMVKNPVLLTSEDADAIFENIAGRDWCEAYILSVDGVAVGANESEDAVEKLLSGLKSALESEDVPGELEIASEIKLEKQICRRELLMSIDELGELLIPGSMGTAAAMSVDQSEMSITAFSALAPSESIDKIDPEVDFGVSRNISQTKHDPVALEYSFVEVITAEEVTPRQIIEFEDDRFLVGHEEVFAEGSDGVRRVTYKVRRDRTGRELERIELESEVISVVSPRIAIVGTKEAEVGECTGSLIWPCRAIEGISSPYGWRDLYGKLDFHLGIDLPDDQGEPIIAADGGEITFAGYTPSYGYNVKIRHDDHTETLYAHLKKITVKVGDIVSQGDQVGTMGHTGVAYGTHLHFEVRIDEKTVDPEKYLPELPSPEDSIHKSALDVFDIYYPQPAEEEPIDDTISDVTVTSAESDSIGTTVSE